MKRYKAVIQLYVDGFTAEHQSEADLIINEYITVLGDVAPMNITWSEVDYNITEMEALRAWEDLRGRTLRY